MKVRRDANERAIVRALERVGARVWRVKVAEPAGFPDLAVWFRGAWYLLEVKTPGGELSPEQSELFMAGASRIVKTEREALEAIRAIRHRDPLPAPESRPSR